mgnify:CR=1 FL=1
MNPLAVTTQTNEQKQIVANINKWYEVAEGALSKNTLSAYKSDANAFNKYCKDNAFNAVPALPETVIGFIKYEANNGRKHSTIQRRLATISQMHRAGEVANPTDSPRVKMALRGLAKKLGTDQKQAVGINEKHTYMIEAKLGDSLKDKRDLAILLVSWNLLARASELVTLKLSDIEPSKNGAIVQLRRTKTSTEKEPQFIGQRALDALNDWIKSAGITDKETFIFQSLRRGNGGIRGKALDRQDISIIIKRLGKLAGIDTSAHSCRVGMAQTLLADNASLAGILNAGGWKSSRMVERYTRKMEAERGAVYKFLNK